MNESTISGINFTAFSMNILFLLSTRILKLPHFFMMHMSFPKSIILKNHTLRQKDLDKHGKNMMRTINDIRCFPKQEFHKMEKEGYMSNEGKMREIHFGIFSKNRFLSCEKKAYTMSSIHAEDLPVYSDQAL